MRRVMPFLLVLVGLLAFAPAVAADTVETPRESFESVGFDAFYSVCGAQTCTDTYVYAEHQTTSSGDTLHLRLHRSVHLQHPDRARHGRRRV